MNDDIKVVNFFAKKGIPISLLRDKRRHKTTPEQVEEAAAITYQDIMAGLKIRDQAIPKYVWNKAKTLKGEKYKEDRIRLANHDKEVLAMEKSYQTSLDANLIRWARLLFISGWGFILIYIAVKLLELELKYEIF